MKRTTSGLLLLAIAVAAFTAYAQYPHGGAGHASAMPRANQGHLPPAPARRPEPSAPPETEIDERGRANALPHVNHDRWYGHDSPNDPRYQLPPSRVAPFNRLGPQYRYSIARFDRDHHRFWLAGGFFFVIADWDWLACADWCWDCGDDFVVYADPDHPGWYLLYNVYTGAYVHVQYLGP